MLTVALLAWAGVVALSFGDSTDLGVLMRSGALVRGVTHQGEWWRLISCLFLHVGAAHLIVNATGLWFLGRLAEDLFGAWRTTAVFALAGITGSFASLYASSAGISAGASGAVFGLLGALFVELTLHRKRHRAAWTRGIWGSLALVTVAQIGIGFLYPVTDQWAHGGGLAAGCVLGVVLSPNVRWQRVAHNAARAITAAFVAASITAAVFVARTSLADSLGGVPQVPHPVGDAIAFAPAGWQSSGDELFDPDLFIVVAPTRVPAPLAAALPAYLKGEPERARSRKFDQVDPARETLVPLPVGWQGSELVVSVADPLGDRQRYRVIVAGRPAGAGTLLVSLYAPETVARDASGYLAGLLASLRDR